jgi:2-oxoglutarate ferredoxin oxidoreductase subunit gamma
LQLNILISGTGGQGVVAAGEFLSDALFRKGYEVMFGRSYGAEARGGSCRSEIMVSDAEINDLQFERSDVLLALSLPAFKKFVGVAKPGSLVLVDSEVLEGAGKVRDDVEIIGVPARQVSLRLGNPIVANMVLLGALARRSDMVKLELLKEAVRANMRPSMQEINLRALDEGYGSI